MRTTNLRQRLGALERDHSSAEPIILHLPDGRTEALPSRDAVGLLGCALRGERTPEMELIARSVSSSEPDGAHMIDLARALLNGPADDAQATSMKPILRRVGLLEGRLGHQGNARGMRVADLVRERPRRRMQANGEPFEDSPLGNILAAPCGFLSVAETLRRCRRQRSEGSHALQEG
jgi:hypothetical protein